MLLNSASCRCNCVSFVSFCSRLKTILDLYPEGNTIFSELIQNADDAGATKVMIMIDENYFGTESLMDSRMAVLQGPSLVVCNDAKFTEADFRSLARIGQGAKLEKINTTGRFGLGFNSTYHITDVPTFVSGEYLVIFDPHCAYAPGANINQPGLRIKFPGSNLTDTFLDQFAPFNYFGCDCKSSYDGTLFRFPLRNSTLARTSEISKRATDLKDMNSALTDLVILLPELLVFLRSVKCVELYYSHTGSKEPVLLHRATAKISNQVFQNDQMLLQFFDKSKESNETTSRDAFYNRLKSTADAKLPRTFQKVSIAVQNFVDGDESDGSDLLKTVGTDVERLYHYLVASGLCGGEAKRMACDENLRQFKLIPLGSVAAQLYVEEEKVMGVEQLEGKAYCFLPLPVKVRLPVYVNAYWELSSNRRDIWHGGDTTGNAKLRSGKSVG